MVAKDLNVKKNSLTREQAGQLYDELQQAVAALQLKESLGVNTGTPVPKPKSSAKPPKEDFRLGPPTSQSSNVGIDPAQILALSSQGSLTSKPTSGIKTAVLFVVLFGIAKATTSVLEFSGVFAVPAVQATQIAREKNLLGETEVRSSVAISSATSPQERSILLALDARRAELEEVSKKIEEKEAQQNDRDREFTIRMTQLREMTENLRSERVKDEKKKEAQIEQLSNVYGSMNPNEAANLIEQLDVTIALSLLQRMPEKRIGQILAMMNRDKALLLTKMLSGG